MRHKTFTEITRKCLTLLLFIFFCILFSLDYNIHKFFLAVEDNNSSITVNQSTNTFLDLINILRDGFNSNDVSFCNFVDLYVPILIHKLCASYTTQIHVVACFGFDRKYIFFFFEIIFFSIEIVLKYNLLTKTK